MPQINNPGGGNCGFYAFAIGLIDIIQKEHQAQGNSNIFNQWVNEGLLDVTLESLLQVDLHQLHQSPRKYEKAILVTLQMSLRNIAANAYKEDLLGKIQTEQQSQDDLSSVECSPIYAKFMEMVQLYLIENPTRRTLKELGKTNELALSSESQTFAQRTTESLKLKLPNKTFAEIQKIENTHVKEALLHDVLSNQSCILKGIDVIKNDGRWATHSDLKEIAAKLNVNLIVTGYLNGLILNDHPTVTLNNIGNAHWTTTVELPNLTPNKKQVKTTQSLETKKRKLNEIIETPEENEIISNCNVNKKKKTQHIELPQHEPIKAINHNRTIITAEFFHGTSEKLATGNNSTRQSQRIQNKQAKAPLKYSLFSQSTPSTQSKKKSDIKPKNNEGMGLLRSGERYRSP